MSGSSNLRQGTKHGEAVLKPSAGDRGIKARKQRAWDLTERVKAFCLARGMDEVGVTPLDRLRGAPPFACPENLVPEARSVVVILKRVNRTVQRVYRTGRSSFPYACFGEIRLYEQLDWAAGDLANLLEDEGYASCPVASNFFYNFHLGQPQLTHRYAAMAAGLGRIGWSGHLISPRYGAGVKLVSVVTEAELIPDPMLDEEVCKRCMACVRACPTEAIHPTKTLTFEIAGKTYEQGYFSKLRCLWGCSGLTRGDGSKYAITDLPIPAMGDERDMREIMAHYAQAHEAREPVDHVLRRFTTHRPCSFCHMVCHPEERRQA